MSKEKEMMRAKKIDANTLALALRKGARYSEALVDHGIGERLIDVAVEEVPSVVCLRRRLKRLTAKLDRLAPDQKLWIAQQDLEIAYRSLREDLYFGAGFTFGLVAAQSEARLSSSARKLAKEIRTVVLFAELPQAEAAAALLETTRAIVAPCFQRAKGRRRMHE